MPRLEAAVDSMDVFNSCHLSKSVTYVTYGVFRPPAKIHGKKKNSCCQHPAILPRFITCFDDSDVLPLLPAVVPPSRFRRITKTSINPAASSRL